MQTHKLGDVLPIQSKNGLVTIPVTREGLYVLGPVVRLPGKFEMTEREWDEAHRARLTRSATKAQRWADKAEELLK